MKTLVVYFSKTGNTKFVGEIIAETTGGEVERIMEIKKRKDGFVAYMIAGFEGLFQKKSQIHKPRTDSADYEIIYIGSPVWGWNMVPAVRGYLVEYPLKGKKVALFCTMGGSGDRCLFNSIKEMTPECDFIGEFSIREVELKDKAKAKTKIKDWVDKAQEKIT
ncbi:MAG: flavodoxin [bacterium]